MGRTAERRSFHGNDRNMLSDWSPAPTPIHEWTLVGKLTVKKLNDLEMWVFGEGGVDMFCADLPIEGSSITLKMLRSLWNDAKVHNLIVFSKTRTACEIRTAHQLLQWPICVVSLTESEGPAITLSTCAILRCAFFWWLRQAALLWQQRTPFWPTQTGIKWLLSFLTILSWHNSLM